MLHCTKKLLKALLAITSVLFFVAGGVLLGVGIWMIVDKIFISDIIGTQLFTAASYLLILAGLVLLIVSFIGCAGTFRENACIIISYFASLVFLFVLILISAILAVAFKADLETNMKNAMNKTITEHYGVDLHNSENQAMTDAWDDTQRRLECCAIEHKGWKVYRQSRWFKQQYDTVKLYELKFVPSSCCVYTKMTLKFYNREHCQSWQFGPPGVIDDSAAVNDALFSKGCYEVAKEFVTDQSVILVAIGFIFTVLLVFGMILSILLYRRLTMRPSPRRQTKADKSEDKDGELKSPVFIHT